VTERVCEHDPAANCGCWKDADGVVQRHAFRFLPGDKVRHGTWKGFTGTVVGSPISGRYAVEWNTIGGAAPSRYQSNFDITHEEHAEVTSSG